MLNFLKTAAENIVAPLVGRVILFVATDGAPYYKDENGVVHPMVGAKGDKGDPGEKGEKGDPGVKGDTGDPGQGVPTGGTNGQILRKVGATNYATEWANIGAAAYAAIAAGASAVQGSDVLPAGFMGLAADSIQLRNNIATLDNCTLSGLYRAAAGATNNPEATGAFICLHMPSGGTANQFGIQIATSDTTARSYVRLKNSGAFGSWIPLAFDTQVVRNTGAENVGGEKTYTGLARFNLGISLVADQLAQWATASRVHASMRGALISSVDHAIIGAGSTAIPGRIALRPNGNSDSTNQVTVEPDGSMLWSGNAASKRATCASLNAFNLNATQLVSGLTTFASEVRIQNNAPGFWLDEADSTAGGFFAVVDAGVFQLQIRAPNFGAYVAQMLQISATGQTFAMGGTNVRPQADVAQNLGNSQYRWLNVFAAELTVSGDEAAKTRSRASLGAAGLDTPLNVQNSAYTIALTDRGGCVTKTSTGSATYTIPAEATTAFPNGAIINLAPTDAAGSMVVAPASGVTLYLAGSRATVGQRTVVAGGLAYIMKMGTNLWVIGGAGVQ